MVTVPETPTRKRTFEGILDERGRFNLKRDIMLKKVNTRLLPLMRAHNIDLWAILDRENNPDPLAEEFAGYEGTRNAYLFFDNGETLEKVAIWSHGPRHDLPRTLYDKLILYGYHPDGLRPHLAEVVKGWNPKRIGINVAETLATADGLTVEMKRYFDETIGPELASRQVSAEHLARDYVTVRLPEETEVYRQMSKWTVDWALEGFSRDVITPGVTTCDDVHWYLHNRATELGLGITWAIPGVRIMRDGEHIGPNLPDVPIMPGDVLNVDLGLSYLGYRTDLKRNAYVLRPGETEPPESLREAFKTAVKVVDVLMDNMRPGRVGGDVWMETIDWAETGGYSIGAPVAGGSMKVHSTPEIGVYSHNVGGAVHDIGARIAPPDVAAYSERVRYKLARDSWYCIELHASTPIPEWGGKVVKVPMEECGVLRDDGVELLNERQMEWILI